MGSRGMSSSSPKMLVSVLMQRERRDVEGLRQ